MSRAFPYSYEMAATHDAPEPVPHGQLPEVYYNQEQQQQQQAQQMGYQQQQQNYQQYYNTTSPIHMKPEDGSTIHQAVYTPTNGAASLYGGTVAHDGSSQVPAIPPEYNMSSPSGKPRRGKICGCSFVVFVLSVVIAMLSAAVIGLAAGTGAEASRANNAESKLAALTKAGNPSATVTVTAPTPTATDFNILDNNCSVSNSPTNGKTYTTQFFGNVTFTMFCNKDAPHTPLMSLFAADFNTCMDACAAYTSYIPGDFAASSNSSNATCSSVSFIPLWTTKAGALKGGAPGNCYLKPGPVNQTTLNKPNIGTECHAAILTGS